MEILAHRGFWITEKEKNTETAFERAVNCSFGIETDIRDFQGKLVISHDLPDSYSQPLDSFLSMCRARNTTCNIALNIKADGLCDLLVETMAEYPQLNCFFFDMSVPEQVSYMERGLPVYTRQSDYEREPVLYQESAGVWMDSWKENWIQEPHIERHLKNRKTIGMISPEIHGRDPAPLWGLIRKYRREQILLCTNIPQKAEVYFHE